MVEADGGYGVVESLTFVHQPQVMYNLTVAGAHTYFVGEQQWLVHNDCDRAALASNLGSQVGDDLQAHHLIPCEYCDEPIIGQAERGGFNFNGSENGILLPDNLGLSAQMNLPSHSGSHPVYSADVGTEITRLNQASQRYRWTPQQAYQAVTDLAGRLRNNIIRMGGGVRLE